MAAYHFNNRIESVVPNLRHMLINNETGDECNVRLTLDVYDTARDPAVATRLLSEEVQKRVLPYQTSAVMGAARSAESLPLAILNTIRLIPQVSYTSTSTSLNNRDTYAMFGRTIPSNDGDAHAALEYFSGVGVTHLGIAYVRDEYGTAYRTSLEKAAAKYGIQTYAAAIVWDQDIDDVRLRETVQESIQKMQASGYRYFVGIIFNSVLQILVEEATSAGIMGPGFFWLFSDGIHESFLATLKVPAGGAEAKAIHGLAAISTGAPETGNKTTSYLEALYTFAKNEECEAYFATKTVRIIDTRSPS